MKTEDIPYDYTYCYATDEQWARAGTLTGMKTGTRNRNTAAIQTRRMNRPGIRPRDANLAIAATAAIIPPDIVRDMRFLRKTAIMTASPPSF